jgi:hypothetical protein
VSIRWADPIVGLGPFPLHFSEPLNAVLMLVPRSIIYLFQCRKTFHADLVLKLGRISAR